MKTSHKIAVSISGALERVRYYRTPILLATGCFDVIHRGHVEMLERARGSFPNHEVWIGLNSDSAVRSLKGESRPINEFASRAIVMAGLQCVDLVFEIDNTRVADDLMQIRPQVWVKGGDYTLETLDQVERKAAEEVGAIIHFVPTLPGYSSSAIIKKAGL